MAIERTSLFGRRAILLIVFAILTQSLAASLEHKKRVISRKRKLNSEEVKSDSKEGDSSEENNEETQEEEPVEDDYVKNIYETKMIEFEDEIEGQTYLDAIEWEDRYWLDFYNLMNTVKGILLYVSNFVGICG